MEKFVYLLERHKYIWDRVKNDWLANQTGTAWSTAIYEDYTIARSHARRDFDYMFSGKADCMRFEKFPVVEELQKESVVGRIVYTYRCCGEDYKVIYRITKKVLL